MDILFYLLLGAVLTLAALWTVARLAGFGAQTMADYDGTGPEFDIRRHLNGPLQCDGVIYGPTGRVTARFVADFHASWTGARGVMTEEFRYDSGSTQSREWRLTLTGDGRIRAEAEDLVGAGQGEQRGSGVRLRYAIRLPASAGGHVLQVTDWMYLLENGTIVNRSQFRKFGIKVAELVATIRPQVAAASYAQAAE